MMQWKTIGVFEGLKQGGLTNIIPPINLSFLLVTPHPLPSPCNRIIYSHKLLVQNNSYNYSLISSINQHKINKMNIKNNK